jgi:DNA-binding HxlR family transcriptional regulator
VEVESDCASSVEKISFVTELLRGKWTLQVLCSMQTKPVRLGQLTRLLPSASKKALLACLRELESARIIVRRDLSETVLRVEYDYADHMRPTIIRLLDCLARWGELLEEERSKDAPTIWSEDGSTKQNIGKKACLE